MKVAAIDGEHLSGKARCKYPEVKMKKQSITIASLLILFCITGTVHAQVSSDEHREVVAERDRLKIELAQLRLRLSKMEDELAAARMALEDAVKKIKGEQAPMPEAAPAADAPAKEEKPDRLKPLGSFASFFAAMPAEARPHAIDGWTQFNLPKAQKWVNENLQGRSVDVSLRLKNHSVERIPSGKDGLETAGWRLKMEFHSETAKILGMDHTVQYRSEDLLRHLFTVEVSEEMARKTKNWKAGQRFRVKGEVFEMSLGTTFSKSVPGSLSIRIKHVNIDGLP